MWRGRLEGSSRSRLRLMLITVLYIAITASECIRVAQSISLQKRLPYSVNRPTGLSLPAYAPIMTAVSSMHCQYLTGRGIDLYSYTKTECGNHGAVTAHVLLSAIDCPQKNAFDRLRMKQADRDQASDEVQNLDFLPPRASSTRSHVSSKLIVVRCCDGDDDWQQCS